MNLFTDYGTQVEQKKKEEEELAREKRMQQAVLEIKKKIRKERGLKGNESGRGRDRGKAEQPDRRSQGMSTWEKYRDMIDLPYPGESKHTRDAGEGQGSPVCSICCAHRIWQQC